MENLKIKEVIVVEGRDDQAAVARAVDATTIATHGYGIRKETLDLIGKAYENQGIIIFTDPDRAGENIRKKLLSLFPGAKQAWLTKEEAFNKGDIGIENAGPEDIRNALMQARATAAETAEDPITLDDLDQLGLAGGSGAMALREAVGKELGIGSGNTKAFLKKLNGFAVTRQELIKAWEKSAAHRQ